ncbi:serine/threonine-protein phosphatase 2A activator [Nematocida major]|uniref:serine/threonine-protein phosphatase 2A activator n=1 Tax=Nematocida major TaxID=1912982 RepID=UPI002008BF89|nr:serine/threonine-protein phosphatase 2A activator [Nematocida major]KAH9385382.1 serine/threonine-protein phosphatase 2A activator [Nematocida major]
MDEILYTIDPERRDVAKFRASEAYKKITQYIARLNRKIQGNEIPGDLKRFYDLSEDRTLESLKKHVLDSEVSDSSSIITPGNIFLLQIEEIVREVPIEEGDQRYGNKGFVNFVERVSVEGERLISHAFPGLVPEDVSVLQKYLQESFGNKSRIDYGTGHELNFFCFLIVLMTTEALEERAFLLVMEHYFSIVRMLILKYKLEPAGSQGMGGLDDYQLLPFLFGSAQFCSREGFFFELLFAEEQQGLCYSKALRFIHLDKTYPPSKHTFRERVEKYGELKLSEEPFSRHSVVIYSLRSVPVGKVNSGTIKMYDGVVLSPYAVIQHFISSKYLRV